MLFKYDRLTLEHTVHLLLLLLTFMCLNLLILDLSFFASEQCHWPELQSAQAVQSLQLFPQWDLLQIFGAVLCTNSSESVSSFVFFVFNKGKGESEIGVFLGLAHTAKVLHACVRLKHFTYLFLFF